MDSDLFQNKYRIESTRLKEWDYSWDGYYHVIIFVKDRKRFPLGKIISGKMCLSKEGRIVRESLLNSINRYPNCEVDTFAIMPNHVHGLIKIGKGVMKNPVDVVHRHVEAIHGRNREANHEIDVETVHGEGVGTIHEKDVETIHEKDVETIHESSLRDKKSPPRNLRGHESSLRVSSCRHLGDKNVRRKMLLFKIVGRFKMRSAKLINLDRNTPGKSFWQARFYDRIIRDEEHLNQTCEYINKNVIKEWRKINNLDID